MIVQDVINHLEAFAPTFYAEDFDNVGLIVGNKNQPVCGILICHDTLEEVVNEAIQKKCNLIVSFHPILFKGLKKMNGNTYVERVVIKAIQNNIAIYAIHTALDNALEGVNDAMCKHLGLQNRKILLPKNNVIHHLVTYVPTAHATEVQNALFKAGAGEIGNYSECSFQQKGIGSFKGNTNSNPQYGKKGKREEVEEIQLQIVFEAHLQSSILEALKLHHPYEEVAYQIYPTKNENQTRGIGMVGEFKEAMEEALFLQHLKKVFSTPCIRHSKLLGRPIKRVAVLGGSGAFAIQAAKGAKADAFVSGDFKYHDFYLAENEIVLTDIGHYESEAYTKDILYMYLTKKITNFAIVLSEVNTNPIQYN